jgi:hypothetical protein
MGRWKQDPKYNVFTFRVNDDLADQIREAAKDHKNMNVFLQEVLEEHLQLQGLNFDRRADDL